MATADPRSLSSTLTLPLMTVHEGRGHRSVRDRQGSQDWSRLGLQGAWRATVAAVKARTVGAEVLRPLSRTELVEFRMSVDVAIRVRDADVSAPIPDKFDGLLDGRRGRVPFERHCPG